jgi:hypothetical protein
MGSGVRQVNYLGIFGGTDAKKPVKTTLVSTVRGGPTKFRGYFRRRNKTAKNNFSFGSYSQNRRKYFQPPKMVDFL